ncbi:MAG TPA: dTDP-glucose 4,6-dehydratase [Steroidobacteraceae bacterium]|nr:dTDP-glucose 4,6-dehydratase [Steroidobacteraceae bacterium]
MRRLLVTGGAGFIGSNFVHYWLDRHANDRVLVLDALTYAGNLANLEPAKTNANFRLVHGDICNGELVESILREQAIDTIVHFAAESHVDRSIVGPDAFIQTNVVGTHALLKAARKIWLGSEKQLQTHRFHHVSTDEVYGSLGPNDPAFTETTPYSPNSPYSASKAASDHLVRAYHHTYGLNVTTSNCSNNYGPYHFPEKLVPLTIVNILLGKPLPIYGDGRNVRDWLHVTDHCRGIEAILERGRVGEVYNIGGSGECENIDLVHRLCEIADHLFAADASLRHMYPSSPAAQGRASKDLISFVKDRPGHDRRYAINAMKSRTELGYAAKVQLSAGLRDVFTWYVNNASWWRAVMDGSYREWVREHYSM